MGDFFDNAVLFLEDYYVYVIGVGLIIILMLIGFLASKRKTRKNNNQNDTMVNINKVNTGSINDVANTLHDNNMEPISDVTDALQGYNMGPADDAANTLQYNTIEPIHDFTTFNNINSNQTATDNEETEILDTEFNTVNSFDDSTLQNNGHVIDADNRPLIEEIKPSNEEKFNKTDVIDFSLLSRPEPMLESRPISPIMDMSGSFDQENTIIPVTIGSFDHATDITVTRPVTDINFDEPTPIQSVNPMPENEAVAEEGNSVVDAVSNQPITDINTNNYNSFVIDKSQYDDILNGEASSTEEPEI